MAAQKEAMVIILDVGKSMSTDVERNIESGKQAIELCLQQKLLFKKTDEVGVVLVGTKETKNDLQSSGYKHIYVWDPIGRCELARLQRIRDISAGGAQGDVIDAVVVAMDMLLSHCGKKKFDKRIFMITDAGCPINADGLDAILQRCEGMDVQLAVMGVGFSMPDSQKSPLKIKGETLLKNMCETTNGVLMPVADGLAAMGSFRAKAVLQRPTYTGLLEIPGGTQIGVVGYICTSEQKFPTLKRLSVLGTDDLVETGKSNIKMQREYFLADDAGAGAGALPIPIEKDNMIKAFKYGKNLVPIDKDFEEEMKLPSDKCLSVICFVSEKAVKRHHWMSSVVQFVPALGDENAAAALSALSQALKETETVAIVRYVYRANAAPKLGFLRGYQNPDPEYESLLFCSLPFTEDLREYGFPSLDRRKNYIPSREQLAASEGFIQSLMMTTEEDGSTTELLDPSDTFNPVLQYFYQCVKFRAEHPDDALPAIDARISEYMTPNADLFANAAASISQMKEKFPLHRDESKEKKGARTWAELAADEGDLELEGYLPAAKRAKIDDGARPISMDNLSEKRVEEVGTMDPVGDFTKMIGRRDADVVSTAVTQMGSRISQLVRDSFKDQLFEKALECLKCLRTGCITQMETSNFNDYLRKLRSETDGKTKNDFWLLVKAQKISLIHENESGDSNVSQEESERFHDSAAVAVAPAAAPVAVVEDDILDMID